MHHALGRARLLLAEIEVEIERRTWRAKWDRWLEQLRSRRDDASPRSKD